MYNRRWRKSKLQQLKAKLTARYNLLFPEPVETRLLQVLGGSTLTIGAVRRGNKPMTITLSRGRLLRSERFRRSVVDDMGVLANDLRWAISVQGKDYEMDVVKAYEKDERLEAAGWRLMYINARELWQNPDLARQNVMRFLG